MIQKPLIIAFTVLSLLSCNDGKPRQKFLVDSTGIVNEVSVVLDNESWKGRVGEAIRDILAAPVYGLPQDEPLFNINQIPTSVFSGFITKNRTILKIELGKQASTQFLKNVYAQPQRVVVVSGMTKDEVISQLKEHGDGIVNTFKKIEIYEKQRLIKKSLYNSSFIKEKIGVDVRFPTVYRVAKDENNFFWIRKDVNTGTLNLMIYTLPKDKIMRNDSIINQIVTIRDSIGKAHIEGPTEGTYMITEYAYTPFQTETVLDGKPALETKGMWEVKKAFMAGPYINYAIEDNKNDRWVIAEGFAYAPSVEKRDYMFELEAIIKSIKIN
ncbi:DUF4837 family protein [Aestuariivivens sediminicola]|uniref:DUF4837 family protein n=1 Tax=Aestuariivivens sediminicola TaxID=2913560 RepID=UPI001F56A0AE|nr:DUF4837 family protein [Aestuariivivens sediminicola]